MATRQLDLHGAALGQHVRRSRPPPAAGSSSRGRRRLRATGRRWWRAATRRRTRRAPTSHASPEGRAMPRWSVGRAARCRRVDRRAAGQRQRGCQSARRCWPAAPSSGLATAAPHEASIDDVWSAAERAPARMSALGPRDDRVRHGDVRVRRAARIARTAGGVELDRAIVRDRRALDHQGPAFEIDAGALRVDSALSAWLPLIVEFANDGVAAGADQKASAPNGRDRRGDVVVRERRALDRQRAVVGDSAARVRVVVAHRRLGERENGACEDDDAAALPGCGCSGVLAAPDRHAGDPCSSHLRR